MDFYNIFYLIIGLFLGYGAKLLFRKEFSPCGKKDIESTGVNIKLDDKIKELEESKIALTNTIENVKITTHQLRTPSSAIKWAIKMILDGDAGELTIEQQELLNKSYLNNERVIKIVDNLLDVSLAKGGESMFNFEKVDFQEIVNTAINSIESLVIKNHQKLIIEKPEKLPKIYLDKERMIIVLQNLLSNAIKYTPEYGKIKIIIQVDKQSLCVKIDDQGVGIPKKDQSKIFSKFFRASNAIKPETDGNGLGLFIAKNIIEKHNGKISLKSKEGEGTEVSFSIPIDKT